jgi:hypothetical protein
MPGPLQTGLLVPFPAQRQILAASNEKPDMAFNARRTRIDAAGGTDVDEDPSDGRAPAKAPAVEPPFPSDAVRPVVEPPSDGVQHELEVLPRQA